jgi:hypothetical protein
MSVLALGGPMRSKNNFRRVTEIEVNDNLAQKIITKQLNDSSSEDFEFRPLTDKEKKEFLNSLDDRGRKILAELEGEPNKLRGSSRGQNELCSLTS